MPKTATIHAQQRWEYQSIARKSDTYLARELNILGQQGWELVTVLHARGKKEEWFWFAFIKRPATGAAPAPTASDPTAAPSPAPSAGPTPDPSKGKDPTESLQGFDLDGSAFEIHEEPDGEQEAN